MLNLLAETTNLINYTDQTFREYTEVDILDPYLFASVFFELVFVKVIQ